MKKVYKKIKDKKIILEHDNHKIRDLIDIYLKNNNFNNNGKGVLYLSDKKIDEIVYKKDGSVIIGNHFQIEKDVEINPLNSNSWLYIIAYKKGEIQEREKEVIKNNINEYIFDKNTLNVYWRIARHLRLEEKFIQLLIDTGLLGKILKELDIPYINSTAVLITAFNTIL